MIKSEVNKGHVYIKEIEGNGLTIMSELCCLVKAVCMGFCEDEKDSEGMTSRMILSVADALIYIMKINRRN